MHGDSEHETLSQTGSLRWGNPTVAGCTGFTDPRTHEPAGRDVAIANGEQVCAPSRTGSKMPELQLYPPQLCSILMGTSQSNPRLKISPSALLLVTACHAHL